MIHKLCVVGPGTVFLHSQCHPADHRIGCFRCFLCDLVGIAQSCRATPRITTKPPNSNVTRRSTDTLCHKRITAHAISGMITVIFHVPASTAIRPQAAPTGSAGASPWMLPQFQESQSQDSHTEAHGIRIKHGSHLPHRKQKYKGKQDRKSPASIPIPFRKITTGTCHQHHQNYIPQQNKIKRGHIHQQCHPKQNGKQKHRLQIIRIGQKIIGVFQFSPVRQIQGIPIDIGVIQQSILIPLPAQ